MQSFAMSLAIALAMAFAYVPTYGAAAETQQETGAQGAAQPPVENKPATNEAKPNIGDSNSPKVDDQSLGEKIDKLQTSLTTLTTELNSRFSALETRVGALETAKAQGNAGVATASNPAVPIAGTVWCFIAVDDRSRTGNPSQPNQIFQGTANNGTNIETLLISQCNQDPKTGSPANHYGGVQKFSGANFNFSLLRDAIRAQPMNANDVIFVYVACHGYRDGNGELGFQMPVGGGVTSQERIARVLVWNEMKAKSVRQTILISDSCASPTIASSASFPVVAPASLQTATVLSWLLLYQTGDVDINGAHPSRRNHGNTVGEFGIYSLGQGAGGYFTQSFLGACASSQTPVSWKKVFDNSQASLTSKFPVQLNDGTAISGQTMYLVP